MPDTSAASSLPQDIAEWAMAAGTFLASLIAGLGMRRGNADRDKPAPNAETAGSFGLIADDAILRDMQANLKDLVTTAHGIRDDLDAEREAAKDRRQADELDRARDEARDYKAELDAIRAGQHATHDKQDEYGKKVDRLLKVMESPAFAEIVNNLKMH